MPHNAAAKKAIRKHAAEHDLTYTQARTELATKDWVVQLATGADFSQPYPFIINADGSTHGFIDHGHVIGFRRPESQKQTIDVLWHDVADDPTQIVGWYMTSSDRFTRAFSEYRSPVADVTLAPARADRDALFGGTGSTDAAVQQVVDRRGLTQQGDLWEDDTDLVLTAWDQEWRVSKKGLVSDESGCPVGTLEGFTPSDDDTNTVVVTAQHLLGNPHLAIGLRPLVWMSDREHFDLMDVTDAWFD